MMDRYKHDEKLNDLVHEFFDAKVDVEQHQMFMASKINRLEVIQDSISYIAGTVFSENINLLSDNSWYLDKDGYLYCKWARLNEPISGLIGQVRNFCKDIKFNIGEFPMKLYWTSENMVYLEIDAENAFEYMPTFIRTYRFDHISMTDIDSDYESIKDQIIKSNQWIKMRNEVHTFLKSLDIIDTLEKEIPDEFE